MLHAAARFCALVLVCFASCHIPNHAATAGEVPATAQSISLGMPPLLVDHPALTALFPQRLVDQPRQIFGWQMGASSNVGVGGIVPLGERTVGMVLSQRHQSLTALEQRQLQFALGGVLGSVRLGAAVRGFDDHSEERRTDVIDTNTRAVSSDQGFTFLEGALGAELTLWGATLDLSGEFRDEDSDLLQSTEEFTGEVVRSEARATTRSAFRFAARAEARLPGDLVAVAGAVVQTGDRAWTTSNVAPPPGTHDLSSFDDEPTVSGGISLWHRMDEEGEVAVFAYRSEQRTGNLRIGNRFDALGRVITQVGVAWRGEVLPRTELLLGVGISRDSTRMQAVFSNLGRDLETTDETRVLRDSFSWGLTHEWRMLRLAGAMRSTLDLDDLFLVVDAGLVF